jgi:hypothetical protein
MFSGLLRRCAPRNGDSIRTLRALEEQTALQARDKLPRKDLEHYREDLPPSPPLSDVSSGRRVVT